MTAGPRVAILSLGREGATGEQRRAESWRQALVGAGAEVVPIQLMRQARRPIPSIAAGLRVLAGQLAPEAIAWSTPDAARLVSRCTALVALTVRSYDPRLPITAGATVLDFVDSLSVSYRQRAGLVKRPDIRAGYRVLAALHGRLERPGRFEGVVRTAAGYGDAKALGAEWFPIFARPRPSGSPRPDHDFVFVGNLSYAPNVDALEYLGESWSDVSRQRPGTTLIVAGRQPSNRVRSLCRQHSWTLVADFEDPIAMVRRGRISVAPIRHQSGISIKVLDAAAAGVPLVVFPQVLAGMAPGFPAVVQADRISYLREALDLLDDPPRRAELADAALTLIRQRYTAEAWAPWTLELLDRLAAGQRSAPAARVTTPAV